MSLLILRIRPLLLQKRLNVMNNACINYSRTEFTRFYCSENKNKSKNNNSLERAKPQSEISSDVKKLGEKVKENTKTVSYMGVILLGVGVTGIMFFAIFRELFSSNSPNNVYSEALEVCKNHPKVQDVLGAPIKGFGEETSRRRRGHVAHTIYEKDGKTLMRMQFYIQGIRNRGTVHLEMIQDKKTNKFVYRYLFVQLDHYPRQTIIIEDNRYKEQFENVGAPLPPLQPLQSFNSDNLSSLK